MKKSNCIGRFIMVFLLAILMFGSEGATAQTSEDAVNLIPRPMRMKVSDGAFKLTNKTKIIINEGAGEVGKFLRETLTPATGFGFSIKQGSESKSAPKNSISLFLTRNEKKLGEEGYSLSVSRKGIVISSGTPAGLFYGIQTLRQLLPADIERSAAAQGVQVWEIPYVEIADRPRFAWRGLMMDCSRTFWSKDYIKRTIRLMALYKLNHLHLHLTDDQGWRLEIKKYPKLTEVGAKFPDKYNEPAERQGFYTQEDIKEIVAYGKKYRVEIVPEIEMPGHALAALASYPELSCTGGPFEIHPFFKGPSIHKEIFCAGNEKTFEFLEDVLDEVIELFPYEYIHIGGDEAPKDNWKKCPKCQARIKKEGLKDEHELQSYFIKRIEEYLNSKGKKIIGWDEILEGGLPPNAAVMSWRGVSGGIAAAKSGHDVVMSPTSHCYFDYDYETTSTMKVYSYEPVPEELNPQQAKYIVGVQANFWSHIDRTGDKVDKQLFPRLLAIAEVGWSPKELKDEKDFIKRVQYQLIRLKELGVKYYDDLSVKKQ